MLLALALSTSTLAAPNGYPTCPDGQSVKLVQDTVAVPAYLDNAERGDVVLTSGGDYIPRRILQTLGQTYNHALIVSQPDNGDGATTFVHDTAIPLGKKSTVVGLVNPGLLSRTPTGNTIGDTLDTLLGGYWRTCNDDHDMAYCFAQGARPISIWRGNTVLLKQKPQVFGSVNVADAAEAWPAYSLPYAVSAYTLYEDALTASGVEANNGPGTMCSGFVLEALNDALALAGHPHSLSPVFYSQPQRVAAANALFNKLRSDGAPVWTADQVVACFAWGGDCAPTSIDAFAKITPGTGLTISPDDVQYSWSLQTPWYRGIYQAHFAGGYSYDRFSHYECCDDVTGQCVRVDDPVPATPVRSGYALLDGPDAPPPGVEPTTVAVSDTRSDWVAYAAGSPGELVETESEACWVADNDAGRLCVSLVGLESEPERLKVSFKEERKAIRKMAKEDPTLLDGEPPVGVGVRSAATADGEPMETGRIADLVLDLPDGPVCRGDSFVAQALVEGDATVQIDGHPGTQAAVTATHTGVQTVTALALFEDGSSESLTVGFEVDRCRDVETEPLRIRTVLSKTRDATVRFVVRPDRDGASTDEESETAVLAGASDIDASTSTYAWDFGDGTVLETDDEKVRHSYAFRDQSEASSGFVVRVVETRPDGTTRNAVTNVSFANPSYSTVHSPVDPHWEMPVEHPRRPRWGLDGLGLPLTVHNLDPVHPVQFETATLEASLCLEVEKGRAERVVTEYGLAEIASRTGLEPGETADIDLQIPMEWTSDRVCGWTVHLRGVAGDLPASATAVFDVDARDGTLQRVTREKAIRALQRRIERAEPVEAGDSVESESAASL